MGGLNGYVYAANNPVRFIDPSGKNPISNYFKNKQNQAEEESDTAIYNMTSAYVTDPFSWNQICAAPMLAQINQLAYVNLIIDKVRDGDSALAAMDKFPEILTMSKDVAMAYLEKQRDNNNAAIDELLKQAGAHCKPKACR